MDSECDVLGSGCDISDSCLLGGKTRVHAYAENYKDWRTKASLLVIAGLYAPSYATASIMSSRTAATEIRPRLPANKAFYIINLLDQPKLPIIKYDAAKVLTYVKATNGGLDISLKYIDRVLRFVEKVHADLWHDRLPVVYFAGNIVHACIDRVKMFNSQSQLNQRQSISQEALSNVILLSTAISGTRAHAHQAICRICY